MAQLLDFDSLLAKYVTTNITSGPVAFKQAFIVNDLLGRLAD
jgi:hypothetical protein